MSSVSVLCRLKPAEDDDTHDYIVIDEDNTNTLIVDSNKKTEKGSESLLFAFDHVVPATACQVDVFNIVKPVVHEALLGYNSTIFTYGQTGSGKIWSRAEPSIYGGGGQHLVFVRYCITQCCCCRSSCCDNLFDPVFILLFVVRH